MRPLSVWLRQGAGAALLCACGCFGPMYNPSGPWGPPGYSQYNSPMYGAPGTFQTLTPGQQYIPGTGSTPGSAPTPTPTYGNGSSAPPYGGGTSPAVPTPSDPGSPYFPSSGEQYNRPRSGASATSLDEAPPFSRAAPVADDSRLGAIEPATMSGPALRPTALLRSASDSSRDGQYAHDTSSYTWLEGVVSYDVADRTWNIVYNLNPDATDEYAGHFTLAESPLSRTFREGERVRVEGRVDPLAKDRFGKPMYFAERVIRKAA